MNLILINSGYTQTVIKRVDRKKYYDTLQKAGTCNLEPFVNFIARCVEQSLDICLKAMEPSAKKNRFMSLAEASKFTPYSKEYLGLLAGKGMIGAQSLGETGK